jgi:hypothetical protein
MASGDKFPALFKFLLGLMMSKILFVTVLSMFSALVHSATPETQVISNQIVAAFNANNLRLSIVDTPIAAEGMSKLDPKAPFTANLRRTNVGSTTVPTVRFNDSKALSFAVNERLLNELTETGAINPNADGSLFMTPQAKSRVMSGAVNMTGVVEARSVLIQNGVVILIGQ